MTHPSLARPTHGTALVLLALAGGFSDAAGQDPVPGPEARPPASAVGPTNPLSPEASDDRYTVYLVTMDQGDRVWELFGHNAILIRDAVTGRDLVWNWGLFNFADVDFVSRLLRGTMLYSMGPSELLPFLEAYRAADRTVYANELLLTQEEARELDELVRRNYLPENRDYIYDYYRDNCSTRVRDAIDTVLNGALRDAYADVLTPRTFRWHSRRLAQRVGWADQGLSLMIGSRADRPITEWDEMFAPLEMMRLLEDFERPDAQGGSSPLLGPREVLYQAGRTELPATPPSLSPLWPLLGLAGAALVSILGVRARSATWARIGLWLTVGLWGTFSGVLGLLMVLIWFTNHIFAQWNVNLFYTSPLGLALAFLAVPALIRRGRASIGSGRVASGIATAIALGSLLVVLLEAGPWVNQGNGEVIALALPLNLAIAWALRQRSGEGAGASVSQQ